MSPIADLPFLLAALAVLAGALIQSVGGIGFAMFAAPLVALVRPDLVPGPMIFAGGITSLLIAWRERASIDFKGAGIAIGGRIPGSMVAALAIGLLPFPVFAVCFALLILAAVALSVTGWRVQATPTSLAVAGFGSGFMGTMTSVGAPPMGIVMQNLPPARLRATIGAFLVGGSIVSILVLVAAGRFGRHELQSGLILIVPLVAGFALSTPLVHRVRPGRVRQLVLAVSALSALALLFRNVPALLR